MPIKYSDSLKKPNLEFNYGLKEVQSLEACMKDIHAFLPYVKIVHPDKGRIPFKPRKFQEVILETISKNNQIVA